FPHRLNQSLRGWERDAAELRHSAAATAGTAAALHRPRHHGKATLAANIRGLRRRPNGRLVPSVADRQVILTAHKRNKRFQSPVSVSALREAVYQMERYGWTVVVGEEHPAPASGGRGRPSPSRPSLP